VKPPPRRRTAAPSDPWAPAREHLAKGEHAQVEALCQQRLQQAPDDPKALEWLGIVRLQQGRREDACALFERVAKLQPGSPAALANLVGVQVGLGRHAPALATADRLLALGGHEVAAQVHRGVALQGLGRVDEALAAYDAALALAPSHHDALNNAGTLLGSMGRHEDALARYETGLAQRPDSPELLNNKGVSLAALGRNDAAVETYRRAAAVRPDYRDVQKNLASLLGTLGRHEEALAAYDVALRLEPRSAELHNNRGTVLGALNRHEESLAAYERALALQAGFVDALNNRGVALAALHRYEESLASFDRALAIDPAGVNAHWNRSLALLRLRRFEEGWREHEWRWKKPEFAAHKYPLRQPIWRGEEAVAGKSVLLVAEQGLGDTLQFVRYAGLLQSRGARVLLFVPEPLVTLLAHSFPGAQVFSKTAAFPAFDFYCGMLTLPLAFGTTAETIPAPPAYLKAPPARVAAWAQRLGAHAGLRVGLAWSGSTTHKNDLNRSLALDALRPLLAVPGVRFCSLQKDLRPEDAATAAALPNLERLGEAFQDFADTAAAIAALDLVITVDTSVAHLAAAMGKPTWILLPNVCDWRWIPEEPESPWYPGARLYWQPGIGRWPEAIARLAQDLAAYRAPPRAAAPQPAIGLAEAAAKAAEFLTAGNLADAEAVCNGILQLDPAFPDALTLLGSVRLKQARASEAVELFRRVVDQRPEGLHALTNMAAALRSAERHREALQFYDRVVSIAPDNPTAYVNRSVSLLALNRLDEALEASNRAIEVDPACLAGLNNRGVVLNEQGRYVEALETFDRALALKPDFVDALNNRGLSLAHLDRHEEAERHYLDTLARFPAYASAVNNLGLVYASMNRVEDAERRFREAFAIKPDYVDAHWNESLMALVRGDFAKGWPAYEWRWKKPEFAPHRRTFHVPQWSGREPLEGRTIFAHFEQGFGDAIQFVRYAALLRERGAKVLLSLPVGLRKLAGHSFPGMPVFCGQEVLPPFDCHVPFLSLPLAFGTTLETIPARVPYLVPPPERVEHWRERLGPAGDRPRVGLVWSGNPKHANDRRRSMPIEAVRRLLALPYRWYGLQRDVRESDAAGLRDLPIEMLGGSFDDFSETAAAIHALDLVISVDTSVAHLGGALGRPTWVLLPFAPDWRWLLDRPDSPWYPGMRLFRQPRTGDYDTVVDEVKRALEARFDARR